MHNCARTTIGIVPIGKCGCPIGTFTPCYSWIDMFALGECLLSWVLASIFHHLAFYLAELEGGRVPDTVVTHCSIPHFGWSRRYISQALFSALSQASPLPTFKRLSPLLSSIPPKSQMDSFSAISIALFGQEEVEVLVSEESGSGSGGVCVIFAREEFEVPASEESGSGSGGVCVIA